MSKRVFTKADCMDWLDQLDDNSIDLFLLDPDYTLLTGNMTNKNGPALFYTRYTAKVSPQISEYEESITSSRFETVIPEDDKHKLDDYKRWCYEWYCKAHAKLTDDSFMFIFWAMKYLGLAYQIFDINRVIFWQQPNQINRVSGDFNYDITPILIIRKGNPRLNKDAGLWDKSSVLKFSKPQGNYVKDKLICPQQKSNTLLRHLVWLSDKDHEGNVIADFFAGSGSLLRAVDEADVMLCDINDKYFDRYFDTYVTDKRVNTCKKIK